MSSLKKNHKKDTTLLKCCFPSFFYDKFRNDFTAYAIMNVLILIMKKIVSKKEGT